MRSADSMVNFEEGNAENARREVKRFLRSARRIAENVAMRAFRGLRRAKVGETSLCALSHRQRVGGVERGGVGLEIELAVGLVAHVAAARLDAAKGAVAEEARVVPAHLLLQAAAALGGW